MNGIMLETVKLLGTGLELLKGEVVNLTPATNLPQGGFFATPRYRDFPGDTPIHLDGDEVRIIKSLDGDI